MIKNSLISKIIDKRIESAYQSVVVWDYENASTISTINLENWFNHYYRVGLSVHVVDIIWLIRQIQGGVNPPDFIRMNDAETSEVYRKLTKIIETAIYDDGTEDAE